MASVSQKMAIGFSVLFSSVFDSLIPVWPHSLMQTDFSMGERTLPQWALDLQLFSASCQENPREGFWLTLPWITSSSLSLSRLSLLWPRGWSHNYSFLELPGDQVYYRKGGAGSLGWGEVLGLAVRNSSHHAVWILEERTPVDLDLMRMTWASIFLALGSVQVHQQPQSRGRFTCVYGGQSTSWKEPVTGVILWVRTRVLNGCW